MSFTPVFSRIIAVTGITDAAGQAVVQLSAPTTEFDPCNQVVVVNTSSSTIYCVFSGVDSSIPEIADGTTPGIPVGTGADALVPGVERVYALTGNTTYYFRFRAQPGGTGSIHLIPGYVSQ